MLRSMVSVGFMLVLILSFTVSPAAAAPMGSTEGSEWKTQTASYKITLRIGPKATMPMSAIATVDRGRPVNRHMWVHIYDGRSGAALSNVVPAVRIADQARGTSFRLSDATPCLAARHEPVPHFGNNLYLPDGTYTVTIGVGKETAVFRGIAVRTP